MRQNILWILIAALVAAVVYYFADIVSYLLIAWLLSMLGRPLMVFFQRKIRFRDWKLGPTGASVLTILSFYLVIFGLLMLFVPTIISQTRHLASVDYPALGEKLKVPFTNLDNRLHQIGVLEASESLGTRTQELLSNWFKPTMLSDFLGAFLATAGNVFVTFASVSFILFFFLQDSRLFLDILHAFVPNHLENKVQHAVKESSEVLTRYFGGLALQTAAFITMVSLGLWVLGVPNALLIGVMGGLFNIVPYVGPIMGIVLGCFFTISSYIESDFGVMLPQLLKVVAAFFGTQMIDNNFVGPYITSASVKAHPLEIFIVTLIAAKLGGVVGMVIGVPVYTVLRVVAKVFFSEFKLVKWLTGQLHEEPASS